MSWCWYVERVHRPASKKWKCKWVRKKQEKGFLGRIHNSCPSQKDEEEILKKNKKQRREAVSDWEAAKKPRFGKTCKEMNKTEVGTQTVTGSFQNVAQ